MKLRDNIKETYWSYLLRSSSFPPVYVFQMAKVGSSTVYYSIKDQLKNVCVHSHDFTPHHRLAKVRALYKYHKKTQSAIKLISLVRDPISRNISVFFQEFERYNGVKYEDSKLSLEALRENFLNNMPHEYPLTWMDRIKSHFEIDPYSAAFSSEGFVQINGETGHTLLILRHDMDNNTKAKILSEYLDSKALKIENYNISSQLDYANLYRKFKKTLVLPDWYLDKMANSKYFQHFYPQEEIAQIIAKYKS